MILSSTEGTKKNVRVAITPPFACPGPYYLPALPFRMRVMPSFTSSISTACEWASSGGVKKTVGDGNNELLMGKGWASE